MSNQIIFVLGMGRSGTSAPARVLALCGASLPANMLPPNDGNPTGYWEPLDALHLNDEILFRHGANWFDPSMRLQLESVFNQEEKREFVDTIAAWLSECAGPLIVIKEPRITALAEFWLAGAARAHLLCKIVIPVRHPNEVAASLVARDGMSLELASVLWLKYNLLAERVSRSVPRVFVEFSNLVGDWRKEVLRVRRVLDIDLHYKNEIEIDAFLSKDLYRQKTSIEPFEVFGQTWMRAVYTACSAAAKDKSLDIESLNEVFHGFSACERTFRSALREFESRFAPRP